eukprot:GHVP01029011.1.p2 GENE.GHVP01029011.1~~GHVP01029011.1.p2  ORF type:complete len:169 (-),score=41.32 GHVP01029011.1:203-709(-)
MTSVEESVEQAFDKNLFCLGNGKKGKKIRREIYCDEKPNEEQESELKIFQEILSKCKSGTKLWKKAHSENFKIQKNDFGKEIKRKLAANHWTINYKNGKIFVVGKSCYGKLPARSSDIYLLDDINPNSVLADDKDLGGLRGANVLERTRSDDLDDSQTGDDAFLDVFL